MSPLARRLRPRSCALLSLALLSLAVLSLVGGCTIQTMVGPRDAGPGVDAQVDGGVEPPDAARLPDPTVDPCTAEGMGATLGQSCADGATCDDQCFCNGVERCEGSVCVVGDDPCVDEAACTAEACLEELNRCFHDPQHELCSDSDACNGVELCDLAMGCTSGSPLYCNDESSCTIDSCDTELGCVFRPRDLDDDSFLDGRCGGDDCDDDPRFGRDIHPGAVEDCMNRRDDDCDGQRDYNDAGCLPTNDTCASAVVLPGEGTYSGSTAGLASDFTLGCRAPGPDAVFRFTLEAPMDVVVTVAGGGFGTAVALRPFASCASPPDDKCGNGAPPTFLRRSLPAGEWAILVQTSSGAAFDLNVRFEDPTPIPPVDVCDAGTQDLCGGAPCTTVTAANFTGAFLETGDNYTLSCASSGSRLDAAYTFTIDREKDVLFHGTTTDEFGSRGAYVTMLTDCGDPGTEVRCVSGNPGELRQRSLPPGRYYVLLESQDTTPTAWNLEATITDPVPRQVGDACGTAVDITETVLGGGGMGTANIANLELDHGTSCGGDTVGYRDATFVFSIGTTRDVELTTNAAASTHFAALTPACGDTDAELRCWSGSGDVVQTWRSLPPGTYYVTASVSRTTGTMTARVVTRTPTAVPANDRCDGAILLNSGDSLRDTTIGFEDDSPGGTCAGTGRPDAYYRVELPIRRRVLVNVSDADASSSTFFVTLRDFCGGASTASAACVTGVGSATVNVTLDPGTYYVQVETPATGTSEYNIDLFLLSP